MRTTGFAMVIGLIVLSGCASRPAHELADHSEAAVRAADAARFTAMTTQDFPALERLLAPELVYTHSNGLSQSRAQLLEALRSGTMRYQRIDVDGVQVTLQGDLAVVSGGVQFTAELKGKALSFPARFLEVHVYRDGRWQLLAWQSTRLAPPG